MNRTRNVTTGALVGRINTVLQDRDQYLHKTKPVDMPKLGEYYIYDFLLNTNIPNVDLLELSEKTNSLRINEKICEVGEIVQ